MSPPLARARLAVRSALSFACVIAIACSSEEKPQRRHGPTATLTGHVHLAPGASLPAYASLDLVRRPLRLSADRGEIPQECVAANEKARMPVQVTPDGKLTNIVVAASDFTRVHEREPKIHEVAIEHCQLEPPIIAATGGDVLALSNKDKFPFEPLVGPSYAGSPLKERIKLPLFPGGIDSIMCSLGAPCGRTDMVVFFHPVHAVTDEHGAFRITNFPASELVRVNAWHPLFEETNTFVWLEPGQQSNVELVLTPRARFVPPPPSAADAAAAH
jgi:hypothetical protein